MKNKNNKNKRINYIDKLNKDFKEFEKEMEINENKNRNKNKEKTINFDRNIILEIEREYRKKWEEKFGVNAFDNSKVCIPVNEIIRKRYRNILFFSKERCILNKNIGNLNEKDDYYCMKLHVISLLINGSISDYKQKLKMCNKYIESIDKDLILNDDQLNMLSLGLYDLENIEV